MLWKDTSRLCRSKLLLNQSNDVIFILFTPSFISSTSVNTIWYYCWRFVVVTVNNRAITTEETCISIRFFSNSKADASELLENLIEVMFFFITCGIDSGWRINDNIQIATKVSSWKGLICGVFQMYVTHFNSCVVLLTNLIQSFVQYSWFLH